MVHLSPAMQKFILHWGEMGDRWGINRSVAQVHALLYLVGKPLTAEDISETLSMARSNVSNSIRELVGWGLIRAVPVMGDRRDHYESLSDVWEMFFVVLDERRKREVAPTIRVLEECSALASSSSKEPDEVRKRIEAMLDFLKTSDGWYGQMRKLPREAVVGFIRMGGKVKKLLGG